MRDQILVTYASEFGSTAGVAEAIGTVLRDKGLPIAVRPVISIHSIASYRAVVVGSPIYNGAWLPEAVQFVRYFADELRRVPVAYFAVCMTVRDGGDEKRRAALTFLQPVLTEFPQIKPIDIGLFAGKIDRHKLPVVIRVRTMFMRRLRQGDARDWPAIRAWATQIQPALLHSSVEL